MPIYNVKVTFETTMVVVAADEHEARDVVRRDALDALQDADESPAVDVRGEVTSEKHLRDGWDGDCVPYGGDRLKRLRELLTPNAPGEGSEAASSEAPTFPDGLVVAVEPAPTFGKEA